jgi:hypothetical protein
MGTRYRVDRQVLEVSRTHKGYALAFQEVTSHSYDKIKRNEYRFMWISPDGKILPLRGGAVVDDPGVFIRLIGKAYAEGWFQPISISLSARSARRRR